MILRVCLTTFLLLQNTINFDLFKFYNFTEEWKFIKFSCMFNYNRYYSSVGYPQVTNGTFGRGVADSLFINPFSKVPKSICSAN